MATLDMDEFVLNLNDMRLKSQKVREWDIYEDGLLKCGICGKFRQVRKKLNSGREYIAVSLCDCEFAEEMERREAELEEERKAKIVELRNRSMMDGVYLEARFDKCVISDDNRKNFQICRKYVENFDSMVEKNQGLIMWGDVGTGKSYASACIANELIDKGISVVMTSFTQLLDLLQRDYSDEFAIIDRVMNARLLIVDDFGAERNTSYALEKVYNLIDMRCKRRLPMIITTNLDFNAMANEDDMIYRRIYDRIFEYCYPMHFQGKSFRRVEANKRFLEMKEMLDAD